MTQRRRLSRPSQSGFKKERSTSDIVWAHQCLVKSVYAEDIGPLGLIIRTTKILLRVIMMQSGTKSNQK